MKSQPTSLSRREFLKVTSSAAGGLMIGMTLPAFGRARPFEQHPTTAPELNAWLLIEPDGTLIIRVAQAEMGQGVMTALPMFIAEELEADWRKIQVEYIDLNRHLMRSGMYGRVLTRDSSAVNESRLPLQLAGAEARERLIKAAAETWGIRPEECYADYGQVYRNDAPDALGYGELAGLAAEISVANVKIKTPEFYGTLGLPTPRLDAPAKVDGSAVYSMDVRLPDMVYATPIHNPVLGGGLQSMRFNAIRHMPGVIKAVRLENAVAIVATTFWQAKKAADALPVFWRSTPANKEFGDTIRKQFFDEFDRDGEVMLQKGDMVTLMDDAERTIESDYYVPYLAQVPIEPLNCTVHVQAERVDIWVGHQDPEAVVSAVSQLTGRAKHNIYIHSCYIGGSFGRRSHTDFVVEATRIAMQVDKPVQVIWTREEDMRAGAYRPMAAMRFKAGFDLDKSLVAITNHSVTHSIAFDQDESARGIDPDSVLGLRDHPYNFPAYRFSHTRKNTHMSSWYWRSGGHSINAFAMECFVDEMATAAEQDPLDYRRYLLRDKPRHLEVLEQLERHAGYRKARLPRGTALGLAIHESYGTVCGLATEVTVTPDGGMRVNKVTAVVDCGNLVNPLSAEAQVEGGIVFGLSAALYGKLTVEAGRILEDNLDTYEILQIDEAPEVIVHWALSGGDHWGGLGEPATPVIAPAVCNALFKITGRRLRSLPIRDYYLQIQ